MPEMTRRDAFRLAAVSGIAVVGSASCSSDSEPPSPSGAGETSHSSAPPTRSLRRELAAVADVPDGAAIDITSAAGEPAYLVRQGDVVHVVSSTCTHARCQVAWQPTKRQFECPCHRGTYDLQGRVVSGPPPRALDELHAVVDNGVVYLDP
jgi:Rieske Fe-S protein